MPEDNSERKFHIRVEEGLHRRLRIRCAELDTTSRTSWSSSSTGSWWPFKTEMLGVEVTVERVDMTDDEQIVAVCARGKSRQRVPILDLPLPTPPPEGADWIAAFRRWARGGR